MRKTPEEIADGIMSLLQGPDGTTIKILRETITAALAAERAVTTGLAEAIKTLRQNYRNDSEHARLIDAALKAAEGR